MDSRAILSMDLRFYVGILLCALINSLGSGSFVERLTVAHVEGKLFLASHACVLLGLHAVSNGFPVGS